MDDWMNIDIGLDFKMVLPIKTALLYIYIQPCSVSAVDFLIFSHLAENLLHNSSSLSVFTRGNIF